VLRVNWESYSNEGLEVEEIIYPEVSTQAVTFVDDINSNGGKVVVEGVMRNCGKKEKEKLWEFSTQKTNWMCMNNRKRNTEMIKVEVQQGKIEKTDVYKHLGNMVNEKGNLDDQLTYMKGKVSGVVKSTNSVCHRKKIGKFEWEAKRLIYEHQAVPAVFFNIEVRTNFRKSDVENLERIQGKLLKGMYGMPKTTPYWGMLYELDVMPITFLITYKRMMLYHNIVNSEDDRIIKHIVKNQEASGHEGNWYGNLRREGQAVGIDAKEESVKGKAKSVWKKEVKSQIYKAAEKKMEETKKNSKKMRFLQKKGNESYLKEVFNDDARTAMKIRLNMVEWIDGNFGGKDGCPLCEEKEDTTEHVFECRLSPKHTVTVKDLEEGRSMMEVVELFRGNEEARKELFRNNVQMNMEILNKEGTL
jgi:hypothetical protein